MALVFTVRDIAAAEKCPYRPGQPVTAHWGMPDPTRVQGFEAARRFAFSGAYRMLRSRISIFASLPIGSLDSLTLQRNLDEIDGATATAD